MKTFQSEFERIRQEQKLYETLKKGLESELQKVIPKTPIFPNPSLK